MTSVIALQAQVAREYARLDLPFWPDPHPVSRTPRDEEYSRLTDPERYRIVHARARVWTEVLGDLPGVEVETFAPDPVDGEGRQRRFDRGVRLTSQRPGTLPLLLLERDVPLPEHDTTLAVLHLSVAEPEIPLQKLPECGCDACDDGSTYLLREIDETISQVVGGPFVVLQGKAWCAHWHPAGGSAGGQREALAFEQAMDLCRRLAAGESVRLPRGITAVVGRSWLGASSS